MIKNFYQVEPKLEAGCHGGEGVVRVANVIKEFASNIQFFHYTVLPPGATIGLHEHGNDEEFYVVLEGNGEMEVNGVVEPVTAGAVIMNPPYGTHGLRNTSDTEELRILVFEVKI